MCRQFLQYLLAALFVFLVATVAAFVYLPWWQALLASGLTFLLVIVAGKLLIQSFLANIGELAKELLTMNGKVLRGATIEVHTIEPTDPPAALSQDLTGEFDNDQDRREFEQELERLRSAKWYRIETTIFPQLRSEGTMTHWDIDDLRLVRSTAKPSAFAETEPDQDAAEAEEFELYDLEIVMNGTCETPETSTFYGPQRLRFKVGVPESVSELTFRYFFEQFGLIRLPERLLPGRR